MKTFWFVRLWIQLMLTRYCDWHHPIKAWRFAFQECWEEYRRDGLSPKRAILEDLSYG